MKLPLRFPIRLKILITLLVVVTGVVSAITYTMAALFHEDKRAYVKGIVSASAIGAAEEARATLLSYRQRLLTYARIARSHELHKTPKDRLLSELFVEFPELVAISIVSDGKELIAAYARDAFEAAGLTRELAGQRLVVRPEMMQRLDQGEVWIENQTLAAQLPVMTMTVRLAAYGAEPPATAAAMIRLDGLMRVAARAKGLELFLTDRQGVLLAHRDPERVARHERIAPRIEAGSESVVHGSGLALEYEEEGREMIGGFAGVGLGELIAAARIPETAAYLASRDLLYRLLILALGLLLLAAFAGLFWAHRLTRPIARLSRAALQIGRGEFDVHVAVESRDEIGDLACSFNRMAAELKAREGALDSTQAQLIQSEKMAAFGQLGAGIAHEVKNPLAGILGCAQLALRKVEKDTPVEKNLQLIEKETRRCKAIIENLLGFARQERAMMRPIDVNAAIRDALSIVTHQLEMSQVEVNEQLAADLPAVHGNSNQLQQVVMNLVMNAQQAMEGERGAVTVQSRVGSGGLVEIVIEDTGPGIEPGVQERIFEPFFTTKPGGKGTGLGLSVSYGIVKDHGGEIDVASEPGQGATFTVALPALHEHVPSA